MRKVMEIHYVFYVIAIGMRQFHNKLMKYNYT